MDTICSFIEALSLVLCGGDRKNGSGFDPMGTLNLVERAVLNAQLTSFAIGFTGGFTTLYFCGGASVTVSIGFGAVIGLAFILPVTYASLPLTAEFAFILAHEAFAALVPLLGAEAAGALIGAITACYFFPE